MLVEWKILEEVVEQERIQKFVGLSAFLLSPFSPPLFQCFRSEASVLLNWFVQEHEEQQNISAAYIHQNVSKWGEVMPLHWRSLSLCGLAMYLRTLIKLMVIW